MEVAAVGAALAAPAVGKEQVMAVLVIFDDLRRDGIVGALAEEADVLQDVLDDGGVGGYFFHERMDGVER